MTHAIRHGSVRSGAYASLAPPLSAVDDWRGQALCRNEPPELFFPLGQSAAAERQVQQAKQICRRCPVCQQCRDWALDQGQLDGIFGATDPADRQALRASARVRG